MTLTFTPLEVLQAFIDYAQNPSDAELHTLLIHESVPASALATDPDGDGYGIGIALVERLADGRFEFAEGDGETALIVVARDSFGTPIDLVAFPRRDAWLAGYIGAAAVLGAQEILAPRISGALTIHRTGLDWLRAGREGVVLVDKRRAAIQLRDFGPFRAADVEHGLHLRELFTLDPPSIVVPQPVDVRRAA